MDEGGKRRNSAMVERQNIFPEGLSKRVVKALLLLMLDARSHSDDLVSPSA
jgi:hypothetical protein